MALTRSKDEVARIAALLESDNYDTADQLAYAVLKEAADIIARRGMWVVRPANSPIWWGPYYTLKQAETMWETRIGPLAGEGGGGEIGWVSPWPDDPPPTEDKASPGALCVCGHPKWWHTTEGKRLYCGPRKAGCKCAGGFTAATR